MGRHWTKLEEKELEAHYPTVPVKELAIIFKRTISGIHKKASKLNLKQLNGRAPRSYSSYTLTLYDDRNNIIRRKRFRKGVGAKSRCSMFMRRWSSEYNNGNYTLSVLKGLEDYV